MTGNRWCAAGSTALLSFPVTALAQAQVVPLEEVNASIAPDSGDTGWLLGASFIAALLLIPALWRWFDADDRGLLSRLTVILSAVTVLFLAIGYSLMFDVAGGDILGGGGNWMLNLMGSVRDGTSVPETGFAFANLLLCLVATTMLVSALHRRAQGGWLMGFAVLWFLVVLVPLTRWTIGAGWIYALGALDLAAGMLLFLGTGVSALVALAIVGGSEAAIPDRGRLVPAIGIAAGLVALAGASPLGAGDSAAVAMLVVTIAAATGALMGAALARSIDERALATGLVGGAVAASVVADGVSFGGAVLTGVLGALAARYAPRLVPRRFRWHDADHRLTPLIASAAMGTLLLAPLLSSEWFGGSGYADGFAMGSQLIAQVVAIIATAAWATIGTVIAALTVGLVTRMRAEPSQPSRPREEAPPPLA